MTRQQSEGEVHVEAMRLILAEMERREDIPDWTIWQHMLNMLETIFQGIENQRDDDRDELMHTRKDRNHWMQARQDAIEAGELMKAEIETLRQQLADAQRAVSDAFAEVNSLREQLDAAQAAVTLQRSGIERLQAFVGGIDNLLEQDRFDRRDIADLLIVLRSNSSATLTSSVVKESLTPAPVAEPIDTEGGA